MKKFTALIAAALIALSFSVPAFAEPGDESSDTSSELTSSAEEESAVAAESSDSSLESSGSESISESSESDTSEGEDTVSDSESSSEEPSDSSADESNDSDDSSNTDNESAESSEPESTEQESSESSQDIDADSLNYKEYKLDSVDMSISLPDNLYILTRDIDKDDPSLKACKLTKEEVTESFQSTDTYIKASAKDFSYDITVQLVKNENTKTINELTSLSNDEIQDVIDNLLKQNIYAGCSKTKFNNVLFLTLDTQYDSSSTKIVGIQEYTIVKGTKIVITFQSYNSKVTPNQKKLLHNIMNSVMFDGTKPVVQSSVQESKTEKLTVDELDIRYIYLMAASVIAIMFLTSIIIVGLNYRKSKNKAAEEKKAEEKNKTKTAVPEKKEEPKKEISNENTVVSYMNENSDVKKDKPEPSAVKKDISSEKSTKTIKPTVEKTVPEPVKPEKPKEPAAAKTEAAAAKTVPEKAAEPIQPISEKTAEAPKTSLLDKTAEELTKSVFEKAAEKPTEPAAEETREDETEEQAKKSPAEKSKDDIIKQEEDKSFVEMIKPVQPKTEVKPAHQPIEMEGIVFAGGNAKRHTEIEQIGETLTDREKAQEKSEPEKEVSAYEKRFGKNRTAPLNPVPSKSTLTEKPKPIETIDSVSKFEKRFGKLKPAATEAVISNDTKSEIPEERTEEEPTEEPPVEKSEETTIVETPEVKTEEEPTEETPEVKAEEEPKEEIPEAKAEEEPTEETPEEKTEEEPTEETPEVKTEEEPTEETPEVKTEEEPTEETPEVKAEEEPTEETPEVKAEEEPKEEIPKEKTEEKPNENEEVRTEEEDTMDEDSNNEKIGFFAKLKSKLFTAEEDNEYDDIDDDIVYEEPDSEGMNLWGKVKNKLKNHPVVENDTDDTIDDDSVIIKPIEKGTKEERPENEIYKAEDTTVKSNDIELAVDRSPDGKIVIGASAENAAEQLDVEVKDGSKLIKEKAAAQEKAEESAEDAQTNQENIIYEASDVENTLTFASVEQLDPKIEAEKAAKAEAAIKAAVEALEPKPKAEPEKEEDFFEGVAESRQPKESAKQEIKPAESEKMQITEPVKPEKIQTENPVSPVKPAQAVSQPSEESDKVKEPQKEKMTAEPAKPQKSKPVKTVEPPKATFDFERESGIVFERAKPQEPVVPKRNEFTTIPRLESVSAEEYNQQFEEMKKAAAEAAEKAKAKMIAEQETQVVSAPTPYEKKFGSKKPVNIKAASVDRKASSAKEETQNKPNSSADFYQGYDPTADPFANEAYKTEEMLIGEQKKKKSGDSVGSKLKKSLEKLLSSEEDDGED